jgi:hypothetical protein
MDRRRRLDAPQQTSRTRAALGRGRRAALVCAKRSAQARWRHRSAASAGARRDQRCAGISAGERAHGAGRALSAAR